MASINHIMYIMGTKNIPMSVRDICAELDEDTDEKHKYFRVHSFLVKFASYFNKNGKNKEIKYTLNHAGRFKFERIEHIYDPVTDTLLE